MIIIIVPINEYKSSHHSNNTIKAYVFIQTNNLPFTCSPISEIASTSTFLTLKSGVESQIQYSIYCTFILVQVWAVTRKKILV